MAFTAQIATSEWPTAARHCVEVSQTELRPDPARNMIMKSTNLVAPSSNAQRRSKRKPRLIDNFWYKSTPQCSKVEQTV